VNAATNTGPATAPDATCLDIDTGARVPTGASDFGAAHIAVSLARFARHKASSRGGAHDAAVLGRVEPFSPAIPVDRHLAPESALADLKTELEGRK
jgi:hypothetical protein